MVAVHTAVAAEPTVAVVVEEDTVELTVVVVGKSCATIELQENVTS